MDQRRSAQSPGAVVTGASRAEAPRAPALLDEADRAALARMHARNPGADPLGLLPGVAVRAIPRHIAIIMDGNGRWATSRGLAREFGHRAGAGAVRTIVTEAARLGVEALTLYSFSLENWKRPKAEVDALMQLCVLYLEGEREEMLRNGVRLRIIGQREGLPREVLEAMDRVCAETAHCSRITLCLAINYGSRAEMVHAARLIAEDVRAGRLAAGAIDEREFGSRLWTHGLPDPDLLIRTAGEMRVSNYLLWQISYAEIVVTQTLWPDFGEKELHAAIREFASRDRRFGGLSGAHAGHAQGNGEQGG